MSASEAEGPAFESRRAREFRQVFREQTIEPYAASEGIRLSRLTSAMLIPAAALSLAACASAPVSVPIPASLEVPASETLAYVALADGVQIYRCQRRSDPLDAYAWVFSAPEARLTDPAGKPFGSHYAGPTWEAIDGSTVTGAVQARDPGPDAQAIPWLSLSATSTSGSGILAKTTRILRIRTIGGSAPATGCDADTVDQILRVPYRAEYRFYTAGH